MFSYQLTVNRNQLIIMEDCSVIINYGLKKEYFELNKDNKIRWQRNVIITKNNMNHYKSEVIGDVLEIQSTSKNHHISEYIEPLNTKLAPGSGWETM